MKKIGSYFCGTSAFKKLHLWGGEVWAMRDLRRHEWMLEGEFCGGRLFPPET